MEYKKLSLEFQDVSILNGVEAVPLDEELDTEQIINANELSSWEVSFCLKSISTRSTIRNRVFIGILAIG